MIKSVKPAKGFAQIVIIAVIAVVIGISGTLAYQKLSKKPFPSPTPADRSINLTEPSPSPTDETVYTEESRSADWKTYTNTKGKFSFKHPQVYSINEKINPLASQDYVESYGTITISPSEKTLNGTIAITSAKTNKTLTQDNILGNGPNLSYLKDFLKNKLIKNIVIGGIPGVMVKDIPVGPGDSNASDTIVIKGNIVYQIIVWGNNKDFDQILSTFKFLD